MAIAVCEREGSAERVKVLLEVVDYVFEMASSGLFCVEHANQS